MRALARFASSASSDCLELVVIAGWVGGPLPLAFPVSQPLVTVERERRPSIDVVSVDRRLFFFFFFLEGGGRGGEVCLVGEIALFC